MGIGLYKPGQGYWTRVLTATAIGVLTLATAAWAWSQMTVVSERLPRNVWSMQLDRIQGEIPKPGQQITLVTVAGTPGKDSAELGSARVKGWDASAQVLTVDESTIPAKDGDPSLATGVRVGDGAAFRAGIKNKATGQPAIAPEVLSGCAAGLAILIGFIVAYYFCAVRPGSVEFLISTDMEMKKVNWSTRKDIISSTWVVIAASVLIAGALFLVDVAFQQFFIAIGIIQS